MDLYGLDFARSLSSDIWNQVVLSFQKRHLLAHSMGIVDVKYLENTGQPGLQLGTKVKISAIEVRTVCEAMKTLGQQLVSDLHPEAA